MTDATNALTGEAPEFKIGEGASASSQTTAGTTPASGTTPAAGTTPPANFYADWKDADLRGMVETKGWKSAEEIAASYKNLQQYLGHDKLPMPKDDKDEAAWNQVYDRLGRPKEAKDYELPVPDGATPEFAAHMAEIMHKAGVSKKQAQALAEANNTYVQQFMHAQQEQKNLKAEQEFQQVQKEWGQAYPENLEHSKRYTRQMNISKEEIDRIEDAIGTKRMFSLFAESGKLLAESPFVGGQGASTGGALTPDAAQHQIKQLMNDSAFRDKLIKGDAAANEKWTRLHQMAHPPKQM